MATQLQQATTHEFVPLSPAIGVEVRGIDLRADLDEVTRANRYRAPRCSMRSRSHRAVARPNSPACIAPTIGSNGH